MWESLVPPEPARSAEYYAKGWWREETFLDDLQRAVRDRPEAAAVIAYENGQHAKTLTYRELAETVDRFAGALIELGVGRGDVVVVHLPNWWALTPLYLACTRIGAVPASVFPPMGGRELGHVLRVTSAKVCVVPSTYGGVDYGQRLLGVAPDTLEHRVVVGDAAATGCHRLHRVLRQHTMGAAASRGGHRPAERGRRRAGRLYLGHHRPFAA